MTSLLYCKEKCCVIVRAEGLQFLITEEAQCQKNFKRNTNNFSFAAITYNKMNDQSSVFCHCSLVFGHGLIFLYEKYGFPTPFKRSKKGLFDHQSVSGVYGGFFFIQKAYAN